MAHERKQSLGKEPEIISPVEHSPIAAEELRQDSLSELARNKVGTWFNNYQTLGVYDIEGCFDPRPVNDELQVIEQNSIGAGFPYKKWWAGIYNYPGVRANVKQTHFAKVENGKRPIGCGAQDTMAKIRAGEIMPSEGITSHVVENVHEDPLVQGIFQAQITSALLKPDGARIFVVTQDHLSGLIHPVAEFRTISGVETRITSVQLRDVLAARNQKELQERYDPRAIYLDGIPSVPKSSLSDEFLEYLEMADRKITDVLVKNPDFSERQAVANPRAFIISSNKIPIQNRLPANFGDFGTASKLHIPRKKGEDEIIKIDQQTIKSAVDQMQYGVELSVKNHNDPAKDFSKTHVMIIENGSYLLSLEIAEQILTKPWMRKWIMLPNHQLFVSETRGSRIVKIEELTPLSSI